MRFVLALVLSACAGAAPAPGLPDEPQAHPCTPASEAPTQVPHVTTPEPAPACDCDKCEPDTRLTAKGYPIPGRGFWCVYFSKPDEDKAPLGVCYTTAKTCTTLRKRALDSSIRVTECAQQEAAQCFTAVDDVEQRVYWRCFDTSDRCVTQRAKMQEKYPMFEVSSCNATAST